VVTEIKRRHSGEIWLALVGQFSVGKSRSNFTMTGSFASTICAPFLRAGRQMRRNVGFRDGAGIEFVGGKSAGHGRRNRISDRYRRHGPSAPVLVRALAHIVFQPVEFNFNVGWGDSA
jgi:hypothetical protein